MQKNPAISVLMPVYNAERYIVEAVQSILKQTFTNFEFIIINDGSTDGTLEVLKKYAGRDARIRLVSRENKGLVATLNEGISIAQAPLIARMDADDISLTTRFLEQVNYLNNHPDVMCVGGCSIIIDEAGMELTLLKPAKDNDTMQEQALRGHCPLDHPAVMVRKKAVEHVGGYRAAFYPAEDLDLWLRIGEIGKLANLEVPVIKYRFLTNSISGRLAEQQLKAARHSCEDAWKRRGLSGIFDATSDWRPNESVQSKHAFLLKFGWWAFNYKNKKAAITYGMKAIRLLPFDKEGWRLLLCAIFKNS